MKLAQPHSDQLALVPTVVKLTEEKAVDLRSFFFLLKMLWSRHVKPSPAIGEKSERSEIKENKVCTVRTIPESGRCTLNDPLYIIAELERIT